MSKNLSSTIWISVEGNISSGKTTLITFLKEQAKAGEKFGFPDHDVYFIDEDINAWGEDLFTNFYKNPTRWAFTFQFKVISIRAKQIKKIREAIIAAGRPGLVISERSLESSRYVFTKMCFEANNITAMEKRVYDDCYDIMSEVNHTDLYIHCTTQPALCKERYLKRAREGETLDIEYLNRCEHYHSQWLNNSNLTNHVIEIDTSQEVSTEVLTSWYNRICELIHKPLTPAHLITLPENS